MAIGKTTTLIENGRTTLTAAFATLALRLQEAADMPHSTVRNRLQKAVQDAHKGTGKYAYMIDHTGDGESGKVIYQCDGDTKSAPYDISDGDGTADTSLDLSKAKTVIPTVSYPEQADDDDHYARMSEGFIADKIYDSLPLYERFISKIGTRQHSSQRTSPARIAVIRSVTKRISMPRCTQTAEQGPTITRTRRCTAISLPSASARATRCPIRRLPRNRRAGPKATRYRWSSPPLPLKK